jgi:hypothetical protein
MLRLELNWVIISSPHAYIYCHYTCCLHASSSEQRISPYRPISKSCPKGHTNVVGMLKEATFINLWDCRPRKEHLWKLYPLAVRKVYERFLYIVFVVITFLFDQVFGVGVMRSGIQDLLKFRLCFEPCVGGTFLATQECLLRPRVCHAQKQLPMRCALATLYRDTPPSLTGENLPNCPFHQAAFIWNFLILRSGVELRYS